MDINTQRLVLRQPRIDDLADLFRIYGDPATNVYNPLGPFADLAYTQTTLETWLTQWQRESFGMWAISHQHQPNHILGFGGLSHRLFAGQHIINLGYRFAVEAWGNGFATEAARTMLIAGFEHFELNIISATARIHHKASQHVLQKVGFHYCQTIYDLPDTPPACLYQLTSLDWQYQTNQKRTRLEPFAIMIES
ncbi:GNAT family N-acetyltransferase [Celerinatantimonas yamalensis]|uniref:GNAT family N-acetyltransferase n=1 Tax=Celerinatantimonas yamalensis TaxID=559956 RepID=A0ABW9G2G2_9GAMM